ncbi:MAG: hypothetical protein C0478_10050 [Planctomyces sp.]|nr:hypothetical protein [Planctomyces sp.]
MNHLYFQFLNRVSSNARLLILIGSCGAVSVGAMELNAAEVSALAPANSNTTSNEPTEEQLAFFEKKIRPVLVANCYTCHSADNKAASGLRVDDFHGLKAGGNRGPGVVPGQPDDSLLIQAVRYQGKLKMPPEGKLSEEQIRDLETWVANGAVWPLPKVSADIGRGRADYAELRREHWAWQPLQKVAMPTVKNEAWSSQSVDRFVLQKLEEKGLEPGRDADPVALLRRVAFDLTGLPPSAAQQERYLASPSQETFTQLVDELIASPAFGEKWGRHWLDVARYGESTGSARNLPYPQAYKYRNYVIDAINRDKPFNEFVQEQIAGDLLPFSSEAEREEHLVATGLLALGVKDVNQRFKVRFVMDNVDEQIDTVTRSVLGLTVSCARCHDHKFDPVSQREYYAVAGIFTSTDLLAGLRNKMGGGGLDYYDTSALLVISQTAKEPDPEQNTKIEKAQKAVAEAREEFERLRGTPEGMEKGPNGRPRQQQARQKWNRLQAELNLLTDPAHLGEVALGARDSKAIADTALRLRGEAEQLGPEVPRGFLELASWEGQPEVNRSQSGRLELAQWMTDPRNALAQRVIVNRVWHHLFGRGIVSTVDNFGVTGDIPSHPELLDHLAQEFIADGYSLKRLVRKLVLTRTYQLSAETVAANETIDPSNRWLWRHSPRRLAAEEIRDGILAAAGTLESSRPEKAAAASLKVIEIRNNGPEARELQNKSEQARVRSVYLPLVRGILPRALEVFDFAEQGMVTGSRDNTTVAPQALFLLNDSLVRGQSIQVAEELLQDESATEEARITQAYRRILGREPSTTELQGISQYLADFEREAADYVASTQIARASVELAPGKKRGKKAAEAVAAVDPNVSDQTAATNGGAVAGGGGALALANADEMEQSDAPIAEVRIEIKDARTAAWGSFVQALFASAEFRYLK